MGKETKEFAYDVNFPAKTDGRSRVCRGSLWSPPQGWLTCSIRFVCNGEKKELMPDEMLDAFGEEEVRNRDAVYELPGGAGRLQCRSLPHHWDDRGCPAAARVADGRAGRGG